MSDAERDKGRLADAWKRADEMPLEARLCGTSFPLIGLCGAGCMDLRMPRPTRSIRFRRLLVESFGSGSYHDPSFANGGRADPLDLERVNMIVSERITSGSSIMPQKRNRRGRIIRGETGRFMAILIALLTI